MATLKGDNYTKQENPTSDNILSAGTLGGRVRVLTDSITLAAAAINDVVKIGQDLHSGAIIVGIKVYNAALGASVTFDIGDSNDEDRYIAAADGNTAGTKRDIASTGQNYKIGTNSGDSTILMKIEGGVATGAVKFRIFYTED